MSRIGKKPVAIPDGVDVKVAANAITIKGKAGELTWSFHPNMSVAFDGAARQVNVARPGDDRQNRALHGLTRAIINNMVRGVIEPFEKRLEVVGVGYNVLLDGEILQLQVGFANPVRLPIPANVSCKVPDQTHVVLQSCDKQAVGQFAAVVRGVRPPEPYKGKGVRYQGEYVKRKAGKAMGAAGK